MKQIKKVLLVLMTVAVIGCGITLAYLNAITNTAINTFSSDKELTLELREPAWDGFEFGTAYPNGVIPGTVANENSTADQEDLGIEQARSYYPGDVISKDPTVKNTCDETEYVAIKVEYVKVNGEEEVILTKSQFNETIGKTVANGTDTGINGAFTQVSENETFDLYVYGQKGALTTLNADSTTPSLFDKVMINPNLETEDGKLPSFRIKITAYAVQTNNINDVTAIEELTKLAIRN